MLRKRIPTEFGRAVKDRLQEIGMTQDELIDAVKKESGKFLDSGYLYKILTGQRAAPKIARAIREVLEIQNEERDAS